jgi:hypothetical protein
MPVVYGSRIAFKIPEADKPLILSAIQTLLEKLTPLMVDLDAEERRALSKMGTKTVEFVTKAYKYAVEHPEFTPGFIDLDEFATDLAAVEALGELGRPLSQIADMVSDSLLLSGNEAYGAALAYYQATKTAARHGRPGAAMIAEDLGTQFAGRFAKAVVAPPPVTGGTPAPATAA